MKKLLITLLMITVAFTAFAGGGSEDKADTVVAPAAPTIKNPDTLVYATYGTIDSLDIVKAYDTASWTNMRQIYEPLIAYKGTTTDEYVPMLAEAIPTVANGGILEDGKIYRFKIKKGIKIHNGDIMTPEDVEYSFERSLVNDPDGGPVWIWTFLFLDEWSTRGDDGISVDFADIDKAIEVDGDYVVFTLAKPFPPFLGVVANTWASVLNKSFVIENGGWDGTEATWKDFNDPAEDEEVLWDVACGTGPYMLERWEKGVELSVVRFDDYWGEKPAIRKGIYKVVEEWSTRKLMLLQGDADIATVDSLYYPEMDKEAGLTVYTKLPSLSVGGIGFNQDIAPTDNPLIYSGKLDGQGVSADFFTDINVRKAFMHSWDVDTFVNDINNGTVMNPVTPVVTGLPFKDPSVKSPAYDKEIATEYFKKAFGGKVWENGFKLDLLFNTGNAVREAGNKMLAENVMSLNPKFEINVRGVEWSAYVDNIRKSNMPIFFIGWAPDYPDPDNYVVPYMHSGGTYSSRCSYGTEEIDALVEAAAVSLDPKERE
ncbi:MAG: ABC transporter substrate-binding protein, partial [Spirochaetales bacterium]|nr:ABC transporter substrate-binding protein [Spirochaetales bacterium]